MKGGILILCALLCIHVAYGYPAQAKQETIIAAEKSNARPRPSLPNGMAFKQMLNVNAKAEQVGVPGPYGLKSTADIISLQVRVYNNRNEAVYWWWVDYSGNPVYYGTINSGSAITQPTYGTHPWLVADINGDLLSSVVPYKSNVELTIH